jgi:hypothetical protein
MAADERGFEETAKDAKSAKDSGGRKATDECLVGGAKKMSHTEARRHREKSEGQRNHQVHRYLWLAMNHKYASQADHQLREDCFRRARELD